LEGAKKVIEMDEKYKMFAEKDKVEEEDLMDLEEESWLSSDEEDAKETAKVKVPIIARRVKKANVEMAVE
jgi:hypothetical protein